MDFSKLNKVTLSRKERKYSGCIHCKSMTLVRLPGCAGDPEGIRGDYGCLICGGVFGCCKSSYTSIDSGDWYSEYETEERPYPDKDKILAMKIMIKMEEKLGADFRDWEVDYSNAISDLIKKHNQELNEKVKSVTEKLAKVRSML